MTATVIDLFCGAGGSSLGAEAAGMRLVMAANHWQTAIDVHQAHFPDAGHDCADISQADPRRYPTADVLLASPECTNHSQARGVSRKRQDPTLWDKPDPAAERSRATMWDVVRFAEQIRFSAIVVENVVEATKWIFWPQWLSAMTDGLGYEHRILSHNSMHHGVPQSRDRIYVVFTRPGLTVDLDMETAAPCTRCERVTIARQGWKNGRRVGRYRQQWTWNCTACSAIVEPAVRGAVDIIDWQLACPRIGDRTRPLADKTRARILAGMQRYGWAPIVPTVTAGGNHHGLLMRNNGGGPEMVTPTDEPARTMTTKGHQSLLMPYDSTGRARALDEPAMTFTTRDRAALVTDLDQLIDDCGFRMLEPHEIAAAMAFPTGYIPTDLTKKDRVKLAGNAVTPPVMTWICGRLLQALEAAA